MNILFKYSVQVLYIVFMGLSVAAFLKGCVWAMHYFAGVA